MRCARAARERPWKPANGNVGRLLSPGGVAMSDELLTRRRVLLGIVAVLGAALVGCKNLGGGASAPEPEIDHGGGGEGGGVGAGGM